MSRIGKKEIVLPDAVKLSVARTGEVVVEGPRGKLSWSLPKGIDLKVEGSKVSLNRKSDARAVRALHGLARSLVANMVTGVSAGFTRDLEIQGVGFRAAVQGKNLNLSLGYSHPVVFPIPEGVKISVADNTRLKVEGIDKQVVGQTAADIRSFYPAEPYKGKGVRYSDEQVARKEGKTVQ